MGRFDLDGLIRRLGGASAPDPDRFRAMLAARRQINTAAFDPDTGIIRANGRAAPLALEDGYEAMSLNRQGIADGTSNGRTAAYPVGDNSVRRHEIFHGLVDQAYRNPSPDLPVSIRALAGARRLAGERGAAAGLADIAEEVAAFLAGRQFGPNLHTAASLSPTMRSYGDLYRAQYGLPHAIPAYALSVATHPATLGAAAATGGMGIAAAMTGEE